MPKWRKLHTKTVDSIDLNEMPDDFTRLLWILLPLKLDRCGRGQDNPAWVRSNVFPLRLDVSVDQVADAMSWYEEHGMIERYENNGRAYFWIPTWHKYQGNTNREADSEFPAPDSYVDPYNPTEEVVSNSRPTQDQLTDKSCSDVDVDTDADTDVDVDADRYARNPFALYEQASGPLSPLIADQLGDLIDEMEKHRHTLPPPVRGSGVSGAEWVCLAIEEAAKSTDRFNFKYLQSICDRWKHEGLQAERAGNGRDSPMSKPTRVYK